MKLKQGVRLDNLRPQMILALLVVRDVCSEFDVECVVTSGSEGRHSETSLHYAGSAIDFRTRDLPNPSSEQSFAAEIRERLTEDFEVVLESDHLHVEWQQRARA